MLDIDHFKSINDTYGHGVGDDAIKAVAITASAHLRANDVLGRLGGEEFGVLLPETSMAEAVKMAERLRTVVSQIRLKTDHGKLDFTASLGVAAWQPDDETDDTVVNRADAALYVSKEQGRNRATAAPQATATGDGGVVQGARPGQLPWRNPAATPGDHEAVALSNCPNNVPLSDAARRHWEDP